jgi:hypothetical protein
MSEQLLEEHAIVAHMVSQHIYDISAAAFHFEQSIQLLMMIKLSA